MILWPTLKASSIRRLALLPFVGALPHHQGGGEDAHAGQHSEFYPHLGWQAARRSCPRYALAGSRSHLRRGSWLRRTLPAFMCCTKPGPSSSRVPSRNRCSSRLFGADGSLDRHRFRPSPWTASTPVRITPNFCGASASRTPSPASSITNNFSLPAATICALYKITSGSSSIFGSSSSTARRRTR